MKYHPDIEFLLQYVNGQLAPALSIAIGIHAKECSLCQTAINELEMLGGEAIEASNSAIDSQDSVAPQSTETTDTPDVFQSSETSTDLAFEALFNEVTSQPQESPDLAETAYDDCAVAEIDKDILTRLGNRDFSSFAWKRVTPRISKAVVPLADQLHQVELLKFAANAKIPKHTHRGHEVTLVLEGDFSDHQDNYPQGEFIVQDDSIEHQPIAGKEGCICLAITDAPLKFTGTFGPLLNWANS